MDGCLWNARWDAGAILRITPQGRIDRAIELPVLPPTGCAFGGPDLRTLYVTSATCGLSVAQLEQYPLFGSILAIEGAGAAGAADDLAFTPESLTLRPT